MGKARSILIREVEVADALPVAILSEQLGYKTDAAVTLESIKSIVADNRHCAFVALANGEVVGWIHAFYTLRLGAAPFCEIGGMVVDLNYRKRGIGKQLVEQVVTWSKNKYATKLRVRCNSKRTYAHIFYQKAGMQELKTQLVFELRLA